MSLFTTGCIRKERERGGGGRTGIRDGLKTSRTAFQRDLYPLARSISISRRFLASPNGVISCRASVPTQVPMRALHIQNTAASVDSNSNDTIILIISVIIIMIVLLHSFHRKRGNLIFLPNVWYLLMTLFSGPENTKL